jgi:hypothetical protein
MGDFKWEYILITKKKMLFVCAVSELCKCPVHLEEVALTSDCSVSLSKAVKNGPTYSFDSVESKIKELAQDISEKKENVEILKMGEGI